MEKRGQVAVFVIVAVLIVVGGILAYFFIPSFRGTISGEVAPSNFIQECIDEELRNGIQLLSKQGGYVNPEGFVLYQDNKVKYLCYTSQYYLPCKVQQPLITTHFENELENLIEAKTDECAAELRQEYESRGFTVDGVGDSQADVEIIPEKIRVIVNAPMTVRKDDSVQSFRNFNLEINSKLYEILRISTSIVDFESTYGNTETALYYQYYPNLVIYKNKLGDGTTIYTVRDVTTEEEFTFASRSLAWPGGLGLNA